MVTAYARVYQKNRLFLVISMRLSSNVTVKLSDFMAKSCFESTMHPDIVQHGPDDILLCIGLLTILLCSIACRCNRHVMK